MARMADDDRDSSEIEDFLSGVGARVRKLRQDLGITQRELAEKANIKQAYVFEIETKGTNLSLKTVFKVASALGITARDLLPGPGFGEDHETKFRDLREAALRLIGSLAATDDERDAVQKLVSRKQITTPSK